MPKYLTYEFLQTQSTIFERDNVLNALRHALNMDAPHITVFLSHRHSEDSSLIKWVKGFFYQQGAGVYIDWQDTNMPEVTNEETANKLKVAIQKSDKFVVLATPKSIESIWIPWEIGLADQMKSLRNIALLPLVHEGDTWEKREYYRLYNRIEEQNGVWKVINANLSMFGTPLKDWLRE